MGERVTNLQGPEEQPVRRVSDEELEAELDRQIASAISKGWRLESRSRYTAVVVYGHRPNHVLHLLLSVFTLGLWIPVWILLAITNRVQREVLPQNARQPKQPE